METEPAGVGGQSDEGGPGNRRRKRHAQLVGRLDHQPAGRLGLGVLEQFGAQVVAAEVMIDDGLDGPAVADHVGHRAELGPGAGVENDQDLAVGQVLGRDIDGQLRQPSLRIQRLQVPRNGERIAHPHVFPERVERRGHRQFAAQRVAVRPDVRGEHEPLMRANDLDEALPGDHGGI